MQIYTYLRMLLVTWVVESPALAITHLLINDLYDGRCELIYKSVSTLFFKTADIPREHAEVAAVDGQSSHDLLQRFG